MRRIKIGKAGRLVPGSVGRAQILLILVVLLPLLVVQSGIYWEWYHARMQEELQSNREMAQAIATAFRAYIHGIRRQELAIGSALAGLQPYSRDDAGRVLRLCAAEHPSVRSWSWISPEGKVMASSEPGAIDMDVTDRDYFKTILSGRESTVTDLFEGRATGAAIFMIARRIDHEGGNLAGMVLAAVDVNQLGGLALSVRRAEEGGYAIFDGCGRIVFSSLPKEMTHLNWMDDDPMLAPALAGKAQSGMFVFPTDHARHFTAHVPVRPLGLSGDAAATHWVVVASRPEATAMRGVYHGLWLVAVVNLVVIAISLIGGLALVRGITRPLGRLSEHARAIAQGDFARRTEITPVRELRDLGDGLNQMATDLQSSRLRQEKANAALEETNTRLRREIEDRKQAEDALRRIGDELDLRVRERTAELSRTVETLKEEVTRRTLAENQLRGANTFLEMRQKQLQALASELTLTEQRERQQLAQVLHDGLQQILVGAKFRLALIEHTENVHQAASEVTDLIDDAIETSRSLSAELSPPALRRGGLAYAMEWLSRWMRDRHGLRVHLTAHDHALAATEEMTVLLFLATRELLFNVVKHAGVKEAEVEMRRVGRDIQVTVSDEGAGFDPARLHTAGEKPSGIGLFSVRERLDILGGRIEIESAPGRGSRFTITAPGLTLDKRAGAIPDDGPPRVSVAVTSSGAAEADAERKIRILLADDHMVMRQGLAELLRIVPDMEVVGEASDGESAIRLAHEVHPDVVLMDIDMPGMDGIQATTLIHREMPDIRIIGLSMFEAVDRAMAMREAGAADYVTKSGPSDALIHTIRESVMSQGSTV